MSSTARAKPSLKSCRADVKVLIAEDEFVPRTILQATLENFGHECQSADDGLKAWRMYQNDPEALIVTNTCSISAPLRCLQRLLASSENQEVP